jgi:ankyrin repeat protein
MQDPDTQIFWLHGAAGCGKSFIYSKLLDHLEARGTTLFFFFCGGDKERSTFTSLLRYWCLQIIQLMPQTLCNLNHVRQRQGNVTATDNEILEIFKILLDLAPPCYLTVDAIDECSDGDDFFKRLAFIPNKFKIMVTSRTPVNLRKDLGRIRVPTKSLGIEPDMSQNDVNHFIATSMNDIDIELSEATKKKVLQRLGESNGMFLWVKLMLDQIRSQTCEFEILTCLDSLPDGLLETYQRIMARINSLPVARRLLALKTFFWVLTVRRPVTVGELQAFLAVQPRSETLDKRRVVPNAEMTILAVCSGFIQFRHPDKKAFFMHFTATQYLHSYLRQQHVHQEIMSSYDVQNLRTNDGLAAAICLRYLSYETIGFITPPEDHAGVIALYESVQSVVPLLSYAISNWFHHLELIDPAEQYVMDLAIQFLSKDVNRQTSWQLYWFSSPASLESKVCPSRFSRLHVASYFGLTHIAQEMISDDYWELLDSAHRSPLWWAASRGHADLAGFLIRVGYDPNAPDRDMTTPVHRAAASGHIDVFKAIDPLASPAQTPLTDGEGWTPLHWAASRGHIAVVRLLGKRALRYKQYGTLSANCSKGRIPLHLAALNGHTELVCELSTHLYHNDMINTRDRQGCTALHLAALQDYSSTVHELLLQGADRTIVDESGKDAIQKAHMMGNYDVCQVLTMELHSAPRRYSPWKREQPLYPTPRHPSRPTLMQPLQIGTSLLQTGNKLEQYGIIDSIYDIYDASGEREIIKINSVDSQDASAIHYFIVGHNKLLEILCAIKGRHWRTAHDGRGRTVLHIASALGYTDVVCQILDYYSRLDNNEASEDKRKAFIDETDDRSWTALHYAAAGRFSTICKTLLMEGAKSNLRNSDNQTALDLAAHEEHQETLETMARYAKLPSEGSFNFFGFSDLHMLARNGTLTETDLDAVNIWQLDEKDALGRTPLYRATEANMDVVARLLASKFTPDPGELLDLCLLAFSNDNTELMKFFLDRISSGTLSLNSGVRAKAQRLLGQLVEQNNTVAIKYLLDVGVDINRYDPGSTTSSTPYPKTPLGNAIFSNATEAAILLIQYGADLAVKASNGISYLDQACRQGLLEVAECLLEHNASTIHTGELFFDMGTTLQSALAYQKLTYLGRTPARLLQSVAMTQLLLRQGSSLLTVHDRSLRPAAWYLIDSWHFLMFQRDPKSSKQACDAVHALLSEHGCAIMMEKGDEKGHVSLHQAVVANDVEALRMHLDAGVPPDWATYGYQNKTPLHIAIENNSFEAARLLIGRGADVENIKGFKNLPSSGIQYIGEQDGRGKMLKLLLDELQRGPQTSFGKPYSHVERGKDLLPNKESKSNYVFLGELSKYMGTRSVMINGRLKKRSALVFLAGVGSLIAYILFLYMN